MESPPAGWIRDMADLPDKSEVTRADIAAGLRGLGLGAGDRVMMHTALSSFGRVAGGAEAVIDAVRDVVTEAGTIMMPSFNHGVCFREDGGGCYDPLTTPTINGRVPEIFRQQPGVHRSWQPTHAFAAWGRDAQRYIEGHHRTLTCGLDSPLGRLYADGGYGLLLGVRYNSNTFHHVVETAVRAPCLGWRTVAGSMKLPDGRIVEGRTWGWRSQGCPMTDRARYADVMAERGLERVTMIGACRAVMFKLSDCYEVLAELFANGIEDAPACSECTVRPQLNDRTVPSDWDEANQCLQPDSPSLKY